MTALSPAVFDEFSDGVGTLDDAFRYTALNRVGEQLLGRSESELRGRAIWESLHEATAVDIRSLAAHAPVSIGRYTAGDERPVEVSLYPEPDGFTVLFRAEAGPADTEAGRLAPLISLQSRLDAVTTPASTRTGIERELCSLLGESELYELVWIAGYSPGWQQLEARGRAGPAAEFMELADLSLADDGRLAGLLSAAISTGMVQHLRDTGTTDWSDRASDYDLRNVCLVPVTYAGSVYDVLAVYSSDGHAFAPSERQLLAALGGRIGSAIHTVEAERLLLTESVVELTFHSTDADSVLVTASRDLDCAVEVLSTLPVEDAPVLYYVAMRDIQPAAIERWAGATDGVRETRLVEQTAGDDGAVFELVLDRASLADTVVSAGAILSSARVADGRAELVCEVAADRDLNDFAARLTDRFPRTELVAKQVRDGGVTAGRRAWLSRMATVFETDLTDRQRTALKAAVYAGYFDSPRKSTGSEIAAALSMTQPTFSYHLRNAQRSLFAALLDQ